MESLLSLGYPFFWENKRSQPIGNSRKCLELVWILGLRCLFARSTGSLCSTLLNVKSLGSISSIRSWTLKGNALFFISAANDMTTSKQGNPFLSTMDDITTASTKSKSVKPPSSKWRPTKAICIMVGIVLLAAVMVMMIIGFTVFEAKISSSPSALSRPRIPSSPSALSCPRIPSSSSALSRSKDDDVLSDQSTLNFF